MESIRDCPKNLSRDTLQSRISNHPDDSSQFDNGRFKKWHSCDEALLEDTQIKESTRRQVPVSRYQIIAGDSREQCCY